MFSSDEALMKFTGSYRRALSVIKTWRVSESENLDRQRRRAAQGQGWFTHGYPTTAEKTSSHRGLLLEAYAMFSKGFGDIFINTAGSARICTHVEHLSPGIYRDNPWPFIYLWLWLLIWNNWGKKYHMSLHSDPNWKGCPQPVTHSSLWYSFGMAEFIVPFRRQT